MDTTTLAAANSDGMIDMVLHSGPVAKFVIFLLLFFSVISWAIMIFKLIGFRKIHNENSEFLSIFSRRNSLESIYKASKGMRSCPMARIFFAGYVDFAGQFRASGAATDIAEGDQRYFLDKIDNITRSLERTVAQEITRMERFLFFLATTGSTSPFIGLFGTVWGIMKSFRMVGITGASSIAVVAPGMAEALVATAAGLVAAVPAVIGYNYFTHRVRVFGTEMDNFSLDFLSLIEKNFVKK
ncbi:MAG: Tol-Pal system subunit TolQ [bacterium]|nr:MAG: Tol-Pal system subunit TolQ [bacterium]